MDACGVRTLLLAACFFAQSVFVSISVAQTPDPSNGHGYFPLDVGNEWQYEHQLYRPQTVDRPVDASETRYERFVVIETWDSPDSIYYRVSYEEFDDGGELIASDTVLVWFLKLEATYGGYDLPDVFSWLRCLESPFDPTDPIPEDCWPFVQASEIYAPELFGPGPVLVKSFSSFAYEIILVHGVGLVRGGGGCEPCGPFDDRDDWFLRYARVSGSVYGAQVVRVEDPDAPPKPEFVVFPNPAQSRTSLAFALTGAETVRLEVFNLLGRLVSREFSSVLAAGQYTETIDVSHLPAGVYFFRLTTGRASKTVTVTVVRRR